MIRQTCFLFFTAFIVGCGGVSVTKNPDPVSVTGSVTVLGKPLSDVVVNFQPTAGGLPATIQVSGGKFEARITPGQYTWFVTKASTRAGDKAIAQVPAAFQEGSMARLIDVETSSPLVFEIN